MIYEQNLNTNIYYPLGYDLKGNTYWEFFPTGNKSIRPRRIWHPFKTESFIFDYFDKLPIQWLQWLRYSRSRAPTLQELVDDEKRLKTLKELVSLKGQELEYKKAVNDDQIIKNMYKELHRDEVKMRYAKSNGTLKSDPVARKDSSSDKTHINSS